MSFHDLDYCGLDSIPSVIFNLTLDFGGLCFLNRFGTQDWDLVSIKIAFVLIIDCQLIIGMERVSCWIFNQQFTLDQWNQMHLDIVRSKLSDLQYLLVSQRLVLIEQ